MVLQLPVRSARVFGGVAVTCKECQGVLVVLQLPVRSARVFGGVAVTCKECQGVCWYCSYL